MSLKKYCPLCITVWVIYPLVFITAACFLFVECTEEKVNTAGHAKVDKTKAMKISTLQTPLQKDDYLVSHYWDNFDFSDTACIARPGITEQAFAGYINILPRADKEVSLFSVTTLLDRTINEDKTGKVYSFFLSLCRKYLYDPNSPVRDDEFYIPVTAYILEDKMSDEVTKARAGFDMEMMLKNRKGDTASDIIYTLADGSIGSLHNLSRDYTLLYFYNPDCPACREMKAYMEASSLINGLLASGKLDILALYPDEDISLWKKHLAQMPSLWINAYDDQQTIKRELVYDLKAIPSLYLIDKDKKVLLKDADAITVEKCFLILLSGNK